MCRLNYFDANGILSRYNTVIIPIYYRCISNITGLKNPMCEGKNFNKKNISEC